jgi:hypothetical protein
MRDTAYATLLFSESDFLSGVGSALDRQGSLLQFNAPPTEAYADRVALRSDLVALGQI